MRRSVEIRLLDMLNAIDAVESILDGRQVEDYESNYPLRLAVERAVEIVSEASRHIPEDLRGRFPDVPWSAIAAIGNKLRHEYHRVDDRIMWKVAAHSLPDLKVVILVLLDDEGNFAST